MNIFEITIQRRSDSRYPVVAEQISAGKLLAVRTEGTLKLEEADFRKLRTLQIRPREYGTYLGRALFCDRVRDAFVRALGESPGGLRVLLFVEAEDGDIKTLHWHKLCAPIGGEWELLALSQRAPFSLYLPSISDRNFPPIGRRDLRALILVASPRNLGEYNLAEFDGGETVSGVRTALGDIPSEVLASVPDSIGAPTLDDLCRQLTETQYTLLHVVCHGKLSRDGDTVLYWTQRDDQIRPVPATALLKRLKTLRGTGRLPYFTFLSACESAMPEAEAALGGLAQRLVRELGMPAVVAMTERVSIATASALAREFYRRLRDGGELDRALVEATAAFGDRYDILVPALFTRLRGQPLFSESLDRPLTPAEIRFGLSQFGELLADRAPVLEPEFEAREATLARSLPAEAETLARSASIERQTALEAINNLCDEVLEMSFNALALGTPPPAYDPRCPFRGLYPFTVADREFFFGREGEVKRLRNRLAEHPFLAVVGKSGCGKSSLVLAGLVPELQAERADLQVADFKPGADPLAQLTAGLAKVDDGPHVIVVDQFEELFTLCDDELKRVRFIEKLLKLAASQTVIVTVRDDFLGECAVYPELREYMERQVLVAPMNLDELRQAVEKQAARVGLRFEGGLTQTLLDDVRDEPGAMPLLQHALWELWKRRHGRWLLSREYREMGKVQEAIARTADEFYRKLSEGEKEQVRNIFVRLTRLDEAVSSRQNYRDTRRRANLEDLVPVGGNLATIKDLVRRLADERLVVTSRNDITGSEEVEVAHEALIQYWTQLRDWLNADRENLHLRERIHQEACDWNCDPKDELLLLQGGRLEDAIAISTRTPQFFNRQEDRYIHECLALRDRKHRREVKTLQKWVAALTFVLAIAVGSGFFAFRQYKEAAKQAATANLRLDAIKVEDLLNSDPIEAMVLAVDATGRSQKYLGEVLPSVQASLYAVTDITREINRIHIDEHAVNSVAFHPGDQMIVTGGWSGKIGLWNLQGEPIFKPVQGHDGMIFSVQFSPQGQLIASTGEDRTVRLWNLKGDLIREFVGGNEGSIFSLSFHPDGKTIAGGRGDGSIQLWDLQGNPIGQPFRGHEGEVYSVAFSPDKTKIVSGSSDGSIRLWDLQGNPIGQPFRGHEDKVHAVAFSPDGTRVVSCSSDGSIRLWDLQGNPIGQPFRGHENKVYTVAFSPDGTKIVSGSRDDTVRLWDLEGNQISPPLIGHSEFIYAVTFNSDGSMIASGSLDKTVRLWDANINHFNKNFTSHGMVTEVAFQPIYSQDFRTDNPRLVSGSLDQKIRFWNLSLRKSESTINSEQKVTALAFSPDGKLLASGGEDGILKLWKVDENSMILKFKGHDGIIESVAFSPDGKLLVSGGEDGTLRLWDLQGRQVVEPFLGHESHIYSVDFSPDGNIIVSGGNDNTVRLWDLQGNLIGGPFRHHEYAVNSVAFSPDGKFITSASRDQTIAIWDLNGNLISPPFKGHDGDVHSVAFSPDSKILVSGGEDGTVRLWTLEGSQIIKPLQAHVDSVYSVEFSPDGQLIASAGRDGTVRVWRGGNVTLWLNSVCGQLRHHLVLVKPSNLHEESASRTCRKLVYERKMEE